MTLLVVAPLNGDTAANNRASTNRSRHAGRRADKRRVVESCILVDDHRQRRPLTDRPSR